jgi:hypothetical protein
VPPCDGGCYQACIITAVDRLVLAAQSARRSCCATLNCRHRGSRNMQESVQPSTCCLQDARNHVQFTDSSQSIHTPVRATE